MARFDAVSWVSSGHVVLARHQRQDAISLFDRRGALPFIEHESPYAFTQAVGSSGPDGGAEVHRRLCASRTSWLDHPNGPLRSGCCRSWSACGFAVSAMKLTFDSAGRTGTSDSNMRCC